MIPATIDFLLRTNADYGEELQFTDTNGPFDLTGLSFAMEVRRYPLGPLLFTVPIGVLNATDGTVSIGISRSTIETAYYTVTGQQRGPSISLVTDIIATHVDDYREPWGEGTVVIQAGVTTNG